MSYQAVEWAIKQAPEMPLPARMVLVVFAEAADEHGHTAYPSIKTVSQYLCCSERNVAKHVKALVGDGLLVRSVDQSAVSHIPADCRPVVYELPIGMVRSGEQLEPKRRGRKPKSTDNGGNSSSGRLENGVNWSSEPQETGGTPVLNGVNSSTKRGELEYLNGVNCSTKRGELEFIQTSLDPSDEPPVEPPTNRARASAGAPDRFDEFWATYPRKEAKGTARKAFKKAVEKVDAQTVIDGALRFAQDPNLPRGESKGFVPHPTTWLNREGWEDDPLPPRPSSTSSKPSALDAAKRTMEVGQRLVAAAQEQQDSLWNESPQYALAASYADDERPF